MDLQILHLYPDCMSLYGDWGNVAVLRRRLEQAGHSVTLREASFGAEVDWDAVHFVFLGAGTECTQRAVMQDALRHREALQRKLSEGLPMLFSGTGFELMGQRITTAAQESFEGLALAEFTAEQGSRRIVGDALGMCVLTGETLVGYQNKCAVLRGIASPLVSACLLGCGNEAQGGAEGIVTQAAVGVHWAGPVLVQNPHLLDWFVSQICAHAGEPLTQALPQEEHAAKAWQMRVQLLRERIAQKR